MVVQQITFVCLCNVCLYLCTFVFVCLHETKTSSFFCLKLCSSFAEGLLISKTFDWRGIQQWQRRNSSSEKRENPLLRTEENPVWRKSGAFLGILCAAFDEATREVQVGMMGGKGPVRGRNCWHSTSGKLAPTFFLLSSSHFFPPPGIMAAIKFASLALNLRKQADNCPEIRL